MLRYPPSLSSPPKRPPPPLIPPPATHRRAPTPLYRRPLLVVAASLVTSHDSRPASGIRAHVHDGALHTHRPPFAATSAQGSPSSCTGSNVGFFRSPGQELGLLSLALVISMMIMSFFTMAVVSLPAMRALMKLSTAMDKLSKVVSKEVPGTLLSLKLSAREINELTQQLNSLSLRRIISGNRGDAKEDRMKNRRSKRGGDDPLIV